MQKTNVETYKFAGFCVSKANKIPYHERFLEVYNDDGVAHFLSKEKFLYPGDDIPKFEYQYMIKIIDMGSAFESNKIYVLLYVVPCPEYCNKELVSRIQQEWDTTDMCRITDVFDYAMTPLICEEIVDYDSENVPDQWYDYYYDPTENESITEVLDAISSVLLAIDGHFGFFMDRSLNGLGTTGWDLLSEMILGKDALHESLKRIS